MITKIKGFALGVIASVSYGLNPLFALPLMAEGMDTTSILFFRYLLAVPIMGALMLVKGNSFRISKTELSLLALFGTLLGLSSITLFESYRFMDAGIASTLLFVYPLMVAVMNVLFFKERMTVVTALCLAGALGGIALLYKGEGGTTLSLLGTFLVMLSSLTYAFYIVGVNRTRVSRMSTLTVTFYALMFGMLIFGIKLLAEGSISIPPGLAGWINVGGLAIFPTAISFLCITVAIGYIGSTPTAILGALEPLTAVVIGVTVFGERLTPRDITGFALILFSVTLVVVGPGIETAIGKMRTISRIVTRK